MKALSVLFAVGLIHLAQSLFGQSPYFQHYQLLRKNEPVQVNALLQDHAGFIWTGTDRGLFQFDGTEQRQLTRADSLGEDYVSALAQDSAGQIWVGHRNGRISIVNQGKITSFQPPEGNAVAAISDILFDRKGRLWFSTFNDGLYYYTHDRLYRLDEADGMPDIFIYDLEEDAGGNIWAGTDRGVAICSLTDRKVTIRVINDQVGLPDNIIRKFARDRSDQIWMASEDAGLFSFDSTARAVNYLLQKPWTLGAIQDFIFVEDRVWIATANSGVVVFNPRDGDVKSYKPWKDVSGVADLERDSEGNIWLGSKAGLARSFGDYVQFLEGTDLGVEDQNVLALAVDHEGHVWFSTSEGLFLRKTDDHGKVVWLRPLAQTKYQSFTTISLLVDRWGYVWAGFYGEGVIRLNPASGKITHIQKELRNGNVLNISESAEGVWLSTLGGGTQISVSGEKMIFKNYTRAEGLSSDYIYQIFTDSKGRVWFATDREGIDRMDDGGFRHYEDGFASKAVYGFAEDGQNRIWANVQGEGLRLVEGDATGLPVLDQGNLQALTTDSKENLILVNDLGLLIWNVVDGTQRDLGGGVGYNERKANLNVVTKDRQGRLYFGTEEGIVVFSEISPTARQAPVPAITGVVAADAVININGPINLPYDQNNLTFRFVGFWYQYPQQLTFQYRLDDYDPDWITTGDLAAVYSSLPPGQYTFRVRVSAGTSFADGSIASLSFAVRPPFWRTGLFYTLTTVLIVLVAYGFIRFRERQLVTDKLVLEAKVHERTLEIQSKNDEIQAQSEEIRSMNDNLEEMVQSRTRELEKKNQALEEYAFINAHNLRAPVASILGLVNLLERLELNEEGKTMVDHLKRSATRLDEVVQSITEAIEKGDSSFYFIKPADKDEDRTEG